MVTEKNEQGSNLSKVWGNICLPFIIEDMEEDKNVKSATHIYQFLVNKYSVTSMSYPVYSLKRSNNVFTTIFW